MMNAPRYAYALTKLAFARMFNKRFPLNVFFVLTNKCNIDCKYCYGDYYHRKGFREFTTEEILSMLDEMKKMGTVFIQLQGGEPLVRKDIGVIIDRCKKHGFNTDLVTNAILIPKKIEEVKKVDSLCISLDGRKEVNDKNRGEGVFDKVIAGIKLAKENKIPTRINSVITTDTQEEDLHFLFDFATENEILLNFCPSFEFKPLIERDRDQLDIEKVEAHYKKLLDLIIEHKKKGVPIQFTPDAYEISKKWPFSLEEKMIFDEKKIPKSYKYFPCRHGDYVVFVDSDGRLYPCCNFWNDDNIINVHDEGSFKAAWDKLGKDPRHGCKACYIYSYIDRNALLSLNPKILFNYMKNIFKWD